MGSRARCCTLACLRSPVSKTRRSFVKKLLPILATALVGSTVFLPLTILAIEVVREINDIVDYGRSVEDSGIPVPVFSLDCRTADRG